ncbi:glycosyltransferase [Pseudomonas sp. JS3066]|uniref:glycosyltransferase n=1 Tax=Pseudomonas sp. JS3066 TaxID=3090665 RepID=UPI002E7B15E0|nr:glycosyltransferase [Pseudomonas sp. JS3066]WVK92847.1 glycosyltransferase [Pseudomonas sp. JS3066]
MKVLHFFKTFAPDQHGGVENFIRHLCHGTAKQGCENTVLSLSRHPIAELQTSSYRLVQVKEDFNLASTSFSLKAISTFSHLAKQADIVHYHFPWPFMDVVHFLARTGKPSVVTYHSDIVRQQVLLQFYRPLMNAFLGSVDAIAATSPNYLESSPTLLRFAKKSCAIPIGLDESLYPKPDPVAVANLKLRFGPRFFLFVGVLRYYKGLHILLEALRGTDIPMVIVGAGPIEQSLRVHAARRGLNNVHFLGPVAEQQKIDLIEASTAVVFPSHLRSEAFGISLLEAAMMGKPMICTEIGTGTSFVNKSGSTGLVVQPGNPDALKGALITLWDDDALCQAFGIAARSRFESVFTSDLMAQAYKRFYTDVIVKTS